MKTELSISEILDELASVSNRTSPAFEFVMPSAEDVLYLANSYNVPRKFVQLYLHDFKNVVAEDVHAEVKKYIQQLPKKLIDGKSLLLTGPVGTGKTALATLISKYVYSLFLNVEFREYYKREKLSPTLETSFVCFWTGAEIMSDFFESKKRFRKKKSFEFLVIDDITKVSQAIYFEALDSILRYREAQALTTLLTCQVSLEHKDFENIFGAPITDLIKGNCEEVAVIGDSKRKLYE